MTPREQQQELSPLRRGVYVATGTFFVGLGTVGAFLPLLPTTPFLLLASYFYVRSSPRLNQRLLRSRLLGGFLRDWQQRGGVRRPVKWLALAVVGLGVTASIIWGNFPGWGIALLLVLAAIGVTVVVRLPVVADEALPAVPAEPLTPSASDFDRAEVVGTGLNHLDAKP